MPHRNTVAAPHRRTSCAVIVGATFAALLWGIAASPQPPTAAPVDASAGASGAEAGGTSTSTAATPEALPADLLQRCARKALRGDFGKVPAWKLAIYQRVLNKGLTIQGRAKRTNYCPQCSGTHCADGSPVRRGICAASRNIPMHSIIWLATDGLLKVCDRGGWVRVGGRYTRRGETANFDVWVPDCPGGCWTGPGTKRNVAWAQVAP